LPYKYEARRPLPSGHKKRARIDACFRHARREVKMPAHALVVWSVAVIVAARVIDHSNATARK
jgi:hypothetical protein